MMTVKMKEMNGCAPKVHITHDINRSVDSERAVLIAIIVFTNTYNVINTYKLEV